MPEDDNSILGETSVYQHLRYEAQEAAAQVSHLFPVTIIILFPVEIIILFPLLRTRLI